MRALEDRGESRGAGGFQSGTIVFRDKVSIALLGFSSKNYCNCPQAVLPPFSLRPFLTAFCGVGSLV